MTGCGKESLLVVLLSRAIPTAHESAVASQAAIDILLEADNVVRCWNKREEVVYHAELGASEVLLEAGYNLDCFLER